MVLKVRNRNVIQYGEVEEFDNHARDFVTFLTLMGCMPEIVVSAFNYLSFKVSKNNFVEAIQILENTHINDFNSVVGHAVKLIMEEATEDKKYELITIMRLYLLDSDSSSDIMIFDAF